MNSARIANIGEELPGFNLTGVVSLDKDKEFRSFSKKDLLGKWSVLFFYPHDFTFVCPTEIAEFSNASGDFRDRGTQVFAVSTDSHFVHLAWRQNHKDLRDLKIPMLADYKKELSQALGILDAKETVPLRATFIVDPEGIIRWVSVNDMKVGRSVKEVIRVLDALQTDELCPCNWEKGQETLSA